MKLSRCCHFTHSAIFLVDFEQNFSMPTDVVIYFFYRWNYLLSWLGSLQVLRIVDMSLLSANLYYANKNSVTFFFFTLRKSKEFSNFVLGFDWQVCSLNIEMILCSSYIRLLSFTMSINWWTCFISLKAILLRLRLK